MQTVGIAQIKEVIFQCKDCEKPHTWSGTFPIPHQCPNCKRPWHLPVETYSHVSFPYIASPEKRTDAEFYSNFLFLLGTIQKAEAKVRFTLALAFDSDSAVP